VPVGSGTHHHLEQLPRDLYETFCYYFRNNSRGVTVNSEGLSTTWFPAATAETKGHNWNG
jgi:hypothetical protein